MIALLIALAIAPCLAIILFVYYKDKYEKEPVGLLVKCFFLGVLSVIPAVIIELCSGLDGNKNIVMVAVYSFAVVGLSEEASKWVFLRFYAFRKKDFNEPFDGIVYAVMISMGFATAENLLYVLSRGWEVGLLRMFTAVPAHATFAILMGYFVGLAKFRKNRELYTLIGLLSAVIFHGFYDFFLLQNDYNLLKLMALVSLILAVVLSFRAMKLNRELSPFKNSPAPEENPPAQVTPEEEKKD